MPQYVCAVNKNHTQYSALPVAKPFHCCGKPMIEQGAQQPATPAPQPAIAAPAEPQQAAKKWWQFWK